MRIALVQQHATHDKSANVARGLAALETAARQGADVVAFAELAFEWFHPQHPAGDSNVLALAEPVEGPTVSAFQRKARELGVVAVLNLFERDGAQAFDSSPVIDADGKYLGKFRKVHIPQVAGFYEKFFFKPGNLGYPVFDTQVCKLGVYICYDRHFPEGWRALALNRAEVIVNPSATVAGLSQYLWNLEQPAAAVANGVYIGAVNRVGTETPWSIGKFYGSSYFVNPRGQILKQGSDDKDELVTAELDLDMVREVRDLWQFFRDRRPETYGDLTSPAH